MRSKAIMGQIATLTVSVLIVAGGVAGSMLLRRAAPEKELPESHAEVALVHTAALCTHQGSLDIQVDGLVTPFREIEIAAEVGGMIIFKDDACNGGQFVTKGTVLLRVDARDYELAVKRLQRELSQAEANLRELDVEIENTQALIALADDQLAIEREEVNRLLTLKQQQIVSDSEVDRARQTELSVRNQQAQHRNQLNLLNARKQRMRIACELAATNLEQAELDLKRTEIVAPVDGVVVEDLVEAGCFVQRSTPLLRLEDTSGVEVKCRLRMEELHWIWRQAGSPGDAIVSGREYQLPPTPVTVTYQLAGRVDRRYQWQGVLTRYDSIGLDEATRTVACRVFVESPENVTTINAKGQEIADNAAPTLVRGMFVEITIHVDPPCELLSVPESAVQPGKSVWVVRQGQLALVRSLPLIELVEQTTATGQTKDYWLVEGDVSGLTADDRVVVPPIGLLTEGMSVRETPRP